MIDYIYIYPKVKHPSPSVMFSCKYAHTVANILQLQGTDPPTCNHFLILDHAPLDE